MDFRTSVLAGGSSEHGRHLIYIQIAIMKGYLSLSPGIQSMVENITIEDKGSENRLFITVRVSNRGRVAENYFDDEVPESSNLGSELKKKFHGLVSGLVHDLRSEFERMITEFDERLATVPVKK